MRLRILFGALLLVLGLALYALLAMAVATRLLPDQWAVEMAFYALAGVAWEMHRAGPFRPPQTG